MSSFAPHVLSVTDLACRRGNALLFEGVGFRLESGGALSVRGPNGSGKSSLLRLLGARMNAAAGEVCLSAGGVPLEERERHVHYVGHRPGVGRYLSVAATLRFQAALLGAKHAEIAPALARLGLAHLAAAPVHQLSAGESRRLALARLLVAPRPLWLLDEPTESLDAAGDAIVEAMAAEHRALGGLIVLATHERTALPGASELTLRQSAA